MRTRIPVAIAALVLFAASASAEVAIQHKWVWCMHNLRTPANVDVVIGLMDRAKKCGYTGFVLADYTFNILDRQGDAYRANIRRVQDKARELGLDLIPTCIGIGYAEGILAHDPNLAEGYPVVDAPFEVKGGALVPVMDSPGLVNGDFEDAAGAGLAGWYPENLPAGVARDADVTHSGRASLRFQDVAKGSTARIIQTVETKPFRGWVLSVWIKSENLTNPAGVVLTAMGKRPAQLSYQDLEVKRTQDWTEHHIAFNSLANEQVRISLEVAGGGGGTVWVDDLRMRPIGFVNILRREACPLKVVLAERHDGTVPDGGTVPTEDKDFSRVVDPKLGNERYLGTFAAWHTPPVATVPAGSRLKDGDRVLASYYTPLITLGYQLTVDVLDPKVYEIIDDQIGRIEDLLRPKWYFMGYDEIRTGGWTPDYDGMTCGEALAKSVKQSCDIIHRHSPGARILVWNDMFDPNHNAQGRKPYYLVKTPWAGSWEGLPKDVVIMDWLVGTAEKSMDFFAARGNVEQMMAGYYDGDPDASAKKWVEGAKASKAKVIGVMYTTWEAKYGDLERFIEAVDKYSR